VQIDALNRLDQRDAEREFLRCCGSTRWAGLMAGKRPFPSVDAAAETGDAIWSSLDRADWLEAFAAHPRIGAGNARGAKGAGADDWSRREQAGVTDASRAEFERLNRVYETRFGYIFIVCATGKSAGEMLEILERRLENDPAGELRAAAEEQRKITRIRLAKLLA
jgi:OHCU decarboxylase